MLLISPTLRWVKNGMMYSLKNLKNETLMEAFNYNELDTKSKNLILEISVKSLVKKIKKLILEKAQENKELKKLREENSSLKKALERKNSRIYELNKNIKACREIISRDKLW